MLCVGFGFCNSSCWRMFEFVLHIGYLWAPSCSSLHSLFSFNFSPPSSVHLHVCCITTYCSSILCFFHSITLTIFLFFPFPSSSLLYLSCHSVTFSSLLLPLHTLCSAFFFLLDLPTPSSLHTLFFLFLSFICFHPPHHPSSPFLDVFPGGVADACLPGFSGAAGVCNDHGKTYALYAITVFRRNQDGSEDCWKTYRRYSDFHDFHMRITEQVCVSLCSRCSELT